MENYETPIPDFGVVGGASWTFNPSMEALNLTFLATTVSYELKKGVIIDAKIWITEIYYSLLKSHLAVQICTVSYVEYFVNSLEI